MNMSSTFLKLWKKLVFLFCTLCAIGACQPTYAQHANEGNVSMISANISTNINQDTIKKINKKKFDVLKKYNLPREKFVIGGSGPLGIRGLREVNDIDILVSDDLRDDLIKKYGVVDDGKTKKIVFPEGDIDAFWEGSFYTQEIDKNDPKVKDVISRAEVIDGLPFESLDDLIYFKRKMNRPKDIDDIKLLLKWKSTQNTRTH